MGEMKSRAVTIGAVEVIPALPAGVTVTPWEATTVEGPVPMTRLTLPPEKHGAAGGLPTASQQCALAQGSLDRLVKAHSPAHQFTGQVALFGDDHGYFWELCIIDGNVYRREYNTSFETRPAWPGVLRVVTTTDAAVR